MKRFSCTYIDSLSYVCVCVCVSGDGWDDFWMVSVCFVPFFYQPIKKKERRNISRCWN